MTTFLSNRDIYTFVVCGIVPQARERLWIATADIKDMYVDARPSLRSAVTRLLRRSGGVGYNPMPREVDASASGMV